MGIYARCILPHLTDWTMQNDEAARYRALKPDGALWFAEHGLAPQRRVAAFQACLTPLWARFSGGCHLDRKIDDLLLAAGFRLEDFAAQYAKGPRIFSYQYSGRARPSTSQAASRPRR